MKGLSTQQAAQRLAANGRNELAQPETTSPVWLLLSQFNSPVIWLLLAACAVSAALREVDNAVAIGAIVVLNGVVGFVQEFRADRSLKALRAMTAPRARVLRDGALALVPAAEVVVGDVLVLEPGDLVAADAHLLEAHALTANEAALTGESEAVEKSTSPTAPGAPLAERSDHLFMGTAVATGSAQAEVTAVGMQTELGRVANLLATAHTQPTPLQKRLSSMGRVLLLVCLAVVVAVVALELFHGQPLVEVLLSGVSLAVAGVPEGLPAVVTIALALGMQRMVQRNVLVRRLHSVETLGSATVVCTDKTGTLTTGQMTVRELWGPDHLALLTAATACCDAELGPDGRTGVGDPTEIAILTAAAQHGITRAAIEAERPRLAVTPFDSSRKRMSVWRSDQVLYVKGAPEQVVALSSAGTDKVLLAAEQFAARGLRVLAVATGKAQDERELTMLGLVAMADPPRTEAIEAVAAARRAGITTVMITGDSPKTALAIAREMGIVRPGEDAALLVHARASPEDKLRIVREWKAKGAVVAMTGDGVNDAPALREAHIGIAMGRGGTEVTREAADMVLTDDNFASIIAAVAEGRGIFGNIRKTVQYLLTGNFGELLVMLAASVVGVPLPLLPLHLLWVNLVTETLPALTLVVDPPDADLMSQPPRRPDEALLGRREWAVVALTGMAEASTVLGVYLLALSTTDLQHARTQAFCTLVFAVLIRAFAARSPTRVFWETGIFSNLKLLGVMALAMSAQLAVCFVPASQQLFGVTALTLSELALALGASLIPTSLLELSKLLRRLVRPAPSPP